MKAVTTRAYPVPAADCFADGICRPDSLLNYLQDIAGFHAEVLGFGYPVMYDRYNVLWMLIRNWYRLERPIRAGELLTVETWPMPPEGMSTSRGFFLFVDGEKVGEAYQVWALVDAEKRCICRIRNFPELQEPDYCDRAPLAKLRRLALPDGLESAGACTVSHADIDSNGHMNNARYMAYVMQALGSGFVQELQINYDRECLAGEKLTLLIGRSDERTFVVGRKEDHAQSFEVMLRLL